MTSNLEIVKLKIALDKLKEKKKSVEKNYFVATKNIQQLIAKANSNKEKTVVTDKQKKLDEATNFAVQYLDKIISQIYSVLIEVIKNNQFQQKKTEEIENLIKNYTQSDAESKNNNADLFQNIDLNQSVSQSKNFSKDLGSTATENFSSPQSIIGNWPDSSQSNQPQQKVHPQYFDYEQPLDIYNNNQPTSNQYLYNQSSNDNVFFDNTQYTDQYFYKQPANINQSTNQYIYNQSTDETQFADWLEPQNDYQLVDNNQLLSNDELGNVSPILPNQKINSVGVNNDAIPSDNQYLIDDKSGPVNSKINLIKEDNLSVPVVESDKLDEINEVSDEVFSPNSFDDENFEVVSDNTSKEILRQIEALDEMNRSDIDFYLSEVEKEMQFDAPKNVKAGLMHDDDYAFNSKFREMEDKLFKFTQEIDTLKAENKTISETNNTLFELLHDKQNVQSEDKPITSIPSASQYFAALDKSVDSAITKLEKVATGIDPFLNAISAEQIKNLENLSMPLIKSLEKTLENLAFDIKVLKEENSSYRKQLSENSFLISALKEEKMNKENELNISYNSWLANNRKLTDLENILNKQAMEIDELDENKNELIENLESKLVDAKNIIDSVILEKEDLVNKNEKLLETIRNLRNIGYGESVDIDGHVETVSLQDIVEKEANKIVESKVSSLLDKYRNEIENIKNESMINLYVNKNENESTVLAEAIRDANPDEITIMQKQISDFENKISDLENKIKSNLRIKQKTNETIDELNNMLGISGQDDYYQDNVISSKMFALEQKISETLRKIDDIEAREKERKQLDQHSSQEIENLVLSSDLYKNIRNELSQMEGRVIELKDENTRVKAENQKINTELEDSFQKFAFNTAKVREIEELLDRQADEFAELSSEKDMLIFALEKALLENDFSYIDKLKDELNLSDYDVVNNFAESNMKSKKTLGEIEELVSKKVNEIIAEKFGVLTQKYTNKVDAINDKYDTMEREYNRLMDDSNFVNSKDLFKSDYEPFSLVPEDENVNELNQEKLSFDNSIDSTKLFNNNQEVQKMDNDKDFTQFIDAPQPDSKSNTALAIPVDNSNVVEEIKNILSSKLQDTIETKDVVSDDDTLKNILKKNEELENRINSIQNLISSNFQKFQEQLSLVSSSNYSSIIPQENQSLSVDQIREIIEESTRFKFKEIQEKSFDLINDMKDEIKETLINEQIKQSESLQKNIDESFKLLGSNNIKEISNLKEQIGESIELRENQRNLIDEFQNKIHELEKENELIKLSNNEKDMELNNSFIAWKNNNAKLEELEQLFIVLQNDMLAFEDDKYRFFNFLESVARKKIESNVGNNHTKKIDNSSNRYFIDNIKPPVIYPVDEKLNKEINEGVEKLSAIINEPQEVIYEKLDGIDNIITSMDNEVVDNEKLTNQVDEYIEKASNDLFENRKDEIFKKYDLILQKIEEKYNNLNESSFRAIDDLSNKLKDIEDKIGNYSYQEIDVFKKPVTKNDDEINDLKDKYNKLQKSYEDLLEKTNAIEFEKQNMSFEKNEIEKDNSAVDYLVSQLMESTKQLRKFEKMLINLDGELNKIETYKLNNQ